MFFLDWNIKKIFFFAMLAQMMLDNWSSLDLKSVDALTLAIKQILEIAPILLKMLNTTWKAPPTNYAELVQSTKRWKYEYLRWKAQPQEANESSSYEHLFT